MFHRSRITSYLFIASLFFVHQSLAEELAPANLPLEYFTRPSQVLDIQLSPDGSHLAILSLEGRRGVVLIVERQGFKPIHKVFFEDDAGVGTFSWVNDERLVFSKVYYSASREQPYGIGELFATNLDGSQARYIFGIKKGKRAAGKVRSGPDQYSAATLLDTLPNDSKNILVVSREFVRGAPAEVYKLNVYSGRAKKVARAPMPSAGFLTDRDGQVRIALGLNREGTTYLWYRETDRADWEVIESFEISNGGMAPLSFATNGEDIYMVDYSGGQPGVLIRYNLASKAKSRLFQDATVDPTRFLFDRDSGKAYGVVLDAGFREVKTLDDSPKSLTLERIKQSFPNQTVEPMSRSIDGRLSIYRVGNAQQADSFYLFDKTTGSATFLMSARPWMAASTPAIVEYLEIEARDGLMIPAYLTLPPACVDEAACPMVVNPHGGPHGPRDYGVYLTEPQALASRGYAVLQMNFRGSGGYGFDFMRKGFKKWGEEIQFDIIDATKAVVGDKRSRIDPKRVCIYGGSFGAYSALQSVIIEPDLFQCAIGAAGVYDLPLLYKLGDVPRSLSGKAYLEQVVGTDEGSMRSQSPLYNAEKIKVPILLLHGEKDERAPVEHAQRLAASLAERDHPHELRLFDGEGHGYFDPKNRLIALEHLTTFLDQHLAP